ncbi:hypothetical protein [Sandaracinus amylolyticus]|uniref:Uncharacterized protein n=1 Tax=Sandaracinus amylolyticus TaxID=927083 RepID=A0A0F6YJY5_9BACT|nr:hypothetical protein [Sandaracinus amylolyticus]AKF08657.1 hypothetical protein DB32_005806 [Sandaracinus amylolyticus]
MALAIGVAPVVAVHAQRDEEPEPTIEEDLARVVVDPIAPLAQLSVLVEHDATYHGPRDLDATTLIIRPAIPFSTWDVQQLARLSIEYEIDRPEGGSGLGVTEIFDLVLVPLGPGRLAVGPVLELRPDVAANPDGGEDGDNVLAGPAVGYVARVGPVTLGALTRTFLAPSEQRTSIQPVVAVTLAPWISVGVGDLELDWDWEEGHWGALPIGLAVDVVGDVFGQWIRVGVEGRYDLHDVDGLYETRVAGRFALLVR